MVWNDNFDPYANACDGDYPVDGKLARSWDRLIVCEDPRLAPAFQRIRGRVLAVE